MTFGKIPWFAGSSGSRPVEFEPTLIEAGGAMNAPASGNGKRLPMQPEGISRKAIERAKKHPSSVYRIYNARGTLIYVGVTDRGHIRQAEHIYMQAWAWEIAETHWEHFKTRKAAEHRERELITTHHPRYNKMLRSRNDDSDPESIEFRLRAEQYDLLKRCYAETERLWGEFDHFRNEQKAKMAAHQTILHRLLRSVREGRPLSDVDKQKIDAYLSHLELLDRHAAEREARKRLEAEGEAA